MSEVTLDEMRVVAAKAFFEESEGDPDYPHKTWKEQYDEMVPGQVVSEEFIKKVYEMNLGRTFKCDEGLN